MCCSKIRGGRHAVAGLPTRRHRAAAVRAACAIETYIAWNYNIRMTYDRLIELIDQYRYKGSVDKFVKEKISDKLGIDLPTKVIDNLKGRFTWIIGLRAAIALPRPAARLRGRARRRSRRQESLKTVMDKFPEMFEERQFGNVTYYAMMPKGHEGYARRGAARPAVRRRSWTDISSSAPPAIGSNNALPPATARPSGSSIPTIMPARARSSAAKRPARRPSCSR